MAKRPKDRGANGGDGRMSEQPHWPAPDETTEFSEAIRKSTDHFPPASTGDDDAPPSMFLDDAPDETPTSPDPDTDDTE